MMLNVSMHCLRYVAYKMYIDWWWKVTFSFDTWALGVILLLTMKHENINNGIYQEWHRQKEHTVVWDEHKLLDKREIEKTVSAEDILLH